MNLLRRTDPTASNAEDIARALAWCAVWGLAGLLYALGGVVVVKLTLWWRSNRG